MTAAIAAVAVTAGTGRPAGRSRSRGDRAHRRWPRRVSILGSTGSVGRSTVDLLLRNRDLFTVEALTANHNAALLAEQARALDARFAAVADPADYPALKDALAGSGIEVACGRAALVEAAERPADWVMAGIVGAAGLEPTLAAVRQGRIVAFANKEVLVSAGSLFMREVAAHGATLLPVDSEHNAIWQCFDFSRVDGIEKITLTCSGGPFRERSYERMRDATPAQAVAHPTWSMGAKISVDSATLMNKGLELIEAYHLFQLPDERIDIVIHPQSIVHGLVTYCDGSVLAHLGSPDMRTPIAYALGWPGRAAGPDQAARSRRDRAPDVRAARSATAFRRCAWRARRCAAAAAVRPCSTPPTRRRCMPSSRAASGSSTSRRRSSARSNGSPPRSLIRSMTSTISIVPPAMWRPNS